MPLLGEFSARMFFRSGLLLIKSRSRSFVVVVVVVDAAVVVVVDQAWLTEDALRFQSS